MVAGGSAWHVGLRRAAHQLYDDPPVFADPYAVPLLGRAGAEALARTPRTSHRTWSRSLRAFAVARSACAERQLARAVDRGVRQYCLLGAGLDTFALRNPWPWLRVVEVDRPEMIALKRALMQEAEITLPGCLTQAGCDLADLPEAIEGLAPRQPAFFSLLGVAPYLAAEALRALFARVLAHGPGSGIVFDYRLPRQMLSHDEQRQHDSLVSRVAAAGEPMVSFWPPEEMNALLKGFSRSEQLDSAALNAIYFDHRTDGLRVLGDAVRVACAWA